MVRSVSQVLLRRSREQTYFICGIILVSLVHRSTSWAAKGSLRASCSAAPRTTRLSRSRRCSASVAARRGDRPGCRRGSSSSPGRGSRASRPCRRGSSSSRRRRQTGMKTQVDLDKKSHIQSLHTPLTYNTWSCFPRTSVLTIKLCNLP